MAELSNMEKSLGFILDQHYLSSQSLVLVKSTSPKHSTKITARAENLLAIHRKIQSHLRNEKPLTEFELRKLLSILKRMNCSSPRDQKVAQSAHDILVKCIYSQTLKKKDQNLQRNNSASTFGSSTSNETQKSVTSSNDSDPKQQSFDIGIEAPYKTDNFKYTCNENLPTTYHNEFNQHADKTSSSNIFSSQSQDNDMPLVKEMSLSSDRILLSDDNRRMPSAASIVLSQTFLKRHGASFNSENENDKTPEPFSVPSLLEKRQNLDASPQSNVLKLRLGDVQFDSDTVSIPMELLSNLNFGSGEGHSQVSACKCTQNTPEKITHNRDFSTNTTDPDSQNKDSLGVPLNFTEENSFIKISAASSKQIFSGSQFKAINEDVSQNKFTLTPDFNFDNNFVLNSNNIQSVNSHNDFGSSKDGENICCPTTSKSNSDLPTISSFSTNMETPILNIEMDVANTDEETNGSRKIHYSKESLCKSDNNRLCNKKIKLQRDSPYYDEYTKCTPNKNTLPATVTSSNTESFENVWCMPSNTKNGTSNFPVIDVNSAELENILYRPYKDISVIENTVSSATKNTSSNATAPNLYDEKCENDNEIGVVKNSTINIIETDVNNDEFENTIEINIDTKKFEGSWCIPDDNIVEKKRFVPIEDVMEMCKSLMEEQSDLEMTEAERTYLEMAADGTATETNDLIFDHGRGSKPPNQTDVNETEQESFVFNLETDYTSDLIEATPFDNFAKKTRQHKIKTLPPRKAETQVSTNNVEIISETQDIIIDETPCSISNSPVRYQNNNSALQLVLPQVQKPMCKEHTLFNPYKKWPRSNSFQEMYKSNYQRKSPRTISQCNKLNIIENVRISDADVTQSQSVGEDISSEETPKNDKTTIFETGNNLSLGQSTNHSVSEAFPQLPNDNATEKSNTLQNQKVSPSENIVFIDGTISKNNEEIDTTQVEPEETFEEKTKKLKEKIMHKRNKYRETWNDKPVTEKVSLKYVRKFRVNIYEDPVNSLLNIGYMGNVNNFYFPREYADMHLIYGPALNNCVEARNIYSETFPNRRLPHRRTFERVDRSLRETGSFLPHRGGEGPPKRARNTQLEKEILEEIAENPSNNMYYRLTMTEINEKLKETSEKAKPLSEALTKMIDMQILSSTTEDYQFKMAGDKADNSDSDSSDEDEQTKEERILEEIKVMSKLEMKKFMEDLEKQRREEVRLEKEKLASEKEDEVEEHEATNLTADEKNRQLVNILRQAGDCSWLK